MCAPGGHASADRAHIFESMVEVRTLRRKLGLLRPKRGGAHRPRGAPQVPIPREEGREVKCVDHYSVWPGCEKWRLQGRDPSSRPYSLVISEIFECPVREACSDLGLTSADFPDPPLMLGIVRSRFHRTLSASFYLSTPLTSAQAPPAPWPHPAPPHVRARGRKLGWGV